MTSAEIREEVLDILRDIAPDEDLSQLDDEVRYYAQGHRYAFYLTRDRAVLSFLDASTQTGVTLALGFPGSTGRSGPRGLDRASGDINYFRGSDPAGWRTGS